MKVGTPVFLAFLLFLSSLFVTPVAATPDDESTLTCREAVSHIPTAENESADVTVEFSSQPNGTVVANYTVHRDHIPYGFRLSIPDEYRLVSAPGFSTNTSENIVWDGEIDSPSIVYQARLLERTYQQREVPQYVEPYHTSESNFTISYVPNHGGASFDVRFPEGGEMGSSMMFIGEVDRVETVESGCHTVQFVVPPGVSNESVEGAVRPIENATTDLGIGGHYDEVTLIVHPSHTDGFVDAPDGVFGADWTDATTGVHPPLHEYVHTRQARELSKNMTWFQEGSAAYLTARFLHDDGHITSGEYDYFLVDARHKAGEGDLRSPETWSPQYDYKQGAIFLGHLDSELRKNGNATMFDVVRSVNRERGTLTEQEFESVLRENGVQVEEGLASKQSSAVEADLPYLQEPLFFPEVVFTLQASLGASFWVAHALIVLPVGVILAALLELVNMARKKLTTDRNP